MELLLKNGMAECVVTLISPTLRSVVPRYSILGKKKSVSKNTDDTGNPLMLLSLTD